MMRPLWRKAPLLLARFPLLLAAVALGGLLLAMVVASKPLLLSSVGSRLLDREMRSGPITSFAAGATYESDDVPLAGADRPGSLIARRDRAFAARMSRQT